MIPDPAWPREQRLLAWLARPIVRSFKAGSSINACAEGYDVPPDVIADVLRWWLQHQDDQALDVLLTGGTP